MVGFVFLLSALEYFFLRRARRAQGLVDSAGSCHCVAVCHGLPGHIVSLCAWLLPSPLIMIRSRASMKAATSFQDKETKRTAHFNKIEPC